MKSNEDILAEIKGEFKKSPPMPESLSEESIAAKLEGVEQEKKPADISFVRGLISAAAVLAIIVISALVLDNFPIAEIVKNTGETGCDIAEQTSDALTYEHEPDTDSQSAKTIQSSILKKAESEEDLIAILKANALYYTTEVYADGAVDVNQNESVTIAGAVTAAPGSSSNTSAKGDDYVYSTTNEQTSGVSEADIIKTDGRYLYILGNSEYSYGQKKLQIFDTETMTYVYDKVLKDEEGNYEPVSEMYLSGNTLTMLITRGYSSYYGYHSYYSGAITNEVEIRTYDVSNKAYPKLTASHTQQGSYVSSRMIGDTLYTVTRYYVFADNEESLKTGYAPSVNGAMISCDCIYIENEDSSAYMCLTAVDTSDPSGEITKSAILTKAEEVYCSADTMYIFGTDNTVDGNTFKERTVINAFKLNGLDIEHTASGKIGGRLLNQYSLDEYDGYLRIAANEYNYSTYVSENLIYVLDGNLEVVGKISGIAENEDIKSVRFLGTEGYVVTYLNTDPLFCFDLSDPKNPKITGELKLPGYSTYLHPVGEDLILGLGYGGTELSADVSKIKLSLFDVSDMSNPKEVDSIVFKHSSSEALSNPRAFIFDSARNLLFLPVTTAGENFYGKVISVGEDSLTLKADIAHTHRYVDYDLLRTAYIGDNAFVVSSTAVTKYSLTDGTLTNTPAKVEESMDVSYDTTTMGIITVNSGVVVATTEDYGDEVRTSENNEVKMTAPPTDLVGNYGTTATVPAYNPAEGTSQD